MQGAIVKESLEYKHKRELQLVKIKFMVYVM